MWKDRLNVGRKSWKRNIPRKKNCLKNGKASKQFKDCALCELFVRIEWYKKIERRNIY
jgi:hypothetical protein